MIHATLERTRPEEFKQLIDVNLLGQAYGAMAALPYLKQQGGALIRLSSGEGKRALPLQSAYAASKHGIVGFTEALRVAPGLLDALFARFGFWLQKTNIPKPPDAPNNLFAPVEGYDRTRGNLDEQELSTSLYTWLQIRPVARWLVTGAVAMLILVVAGSFRNRSA